MIFVCARLVSEIGHGHVDHTKIMVPTIGIRAVVPRISALPDKRVVKSLGFSIVVDMHGLVYCSSSCRG